jgi:hypothetical protein
MPSEDIDRALGELQGSLRNFQQNWQEQDRRAAQGRRELYQEFSLLKDRISRMSADVENLAVDVREMQPAVRDWVIVKAQGIGASAAASWIGRALLLAAGGLLTFIGWLFNHVLSGGSQPPSTH